MLESCPPSAANRIGKAGLAGVTGSVATMLAIGCLGPSATQPKYGEPSLAPPWFVVVHPPDLLVYVLVIAALVFGAGGVGAALLAARRGWSPSPRMLLAGGAVATGLLLLVPPMGSTDVLHYAASGRIATLGADPYSVSPADLARSGDSVGRHAMADMWSFLPSSYGPVATATQWLASQLGGASTLRTVWWIAAVNGVGFVTAGLLLDKLAGPDRARRVRAQLMWSLNPLLLWHLVVGAHVDGVAVLAAVVGLVALTSRRSGPLWSGGLAGAALALAASTKISYLILVPGFVWALRHDRRRLMAGAAGGAVVAAALYAPRFPESVLVPIQEGTRVMGASSWAPILQSLLGTPLSASGAKFVITAASLIAFLVLAVLLARGLPRGYTDTVAAQAARPTVAIVAAWLLTTPHAAPWYDVMAWVLVPLLPVCWFGPALLAHTALLSFGYLYLPTGEPQPQWLQQLSSIDVLHKIIPLGITAVALVVAAFSVRAWLRRRPSPPRMSVAKTDTPGGG